MLWLPSLAYFTRLREWLHFEKHTNTRGFEVTALEKKKGAFWHQVKFNTPVIEPTH